MSSEMKAINAKLNERIKEEKLDAHEEYLYKIAYLQGSRDVLDIV